MKKLVSLILVVLLLALAGPSQALYFELVTLKASAAVTATGNSTGVDLVKAIYSTDNRHKGTQLAIYLDITAASGTTPTLDVKVQCSLDNSTWFDPAALSTATGTANRDHYAFAQKTTTGQDIKIIAVSPCRYLRESHTVGGTTPSFTYSVKAEVVGGDDRIISP